MFRPPSQRCRQSWSSSGSQDQLVEARRETVTLHRRAVFTKTGTALQHPVTSIDDVTRAALTRTQQDAAPSLTEPFQPSAAGQPAPRTYAAALLSGAVPSAPTAPPALSGSVPALPPGLHEHVTFVSPLAPTTTPARDLLRLKNNIDPVKKGIRDVPLQQARYQPRHLPTPASTPTPACPPTPAA
ncbi:hypothetical protein MRX96_000283 [Rhipicephalus microplus]